MVISLGCAYHLAAIHTLKNGDVVAARDWAEQEVEVTLYSRGKDSPSFDSIVDWIERNFANVAHVEEAHQDE